MEDEINPGDLVRVNCDSGLDYCNYTAKFRCRNSINGKSLKVEKVTDGLFGIMLNTTDIDYEVDGLKQYECACPRSALTIVNADTHISITVKKSIIKRLRDSGMNIEEIRECFSEIIDHSFSEGEVTEKAPRYIEL